MVSVFLEWSRSSSMSSGIEVVCVLAECRYVELFIVQSASP